ncbi:MAG TPA: amidohydrolase family protein, partial [Pyrinomonadaceae bacterium]|nr:amidohydrolase family protein [Pyrinomonadaceae bacterium]
EFHYLHRTPEGTPYDDPNLLAREVVRAARDTGLRIALLRVAYARSGFQLAPNPQQSRFIETDADTYLRHVEQLKRDIELQYSVPFVEAQPTKETHAQATKDAGTQPTPKGAHTQATNGADANAANEDGMFTLIAPHAWVGVAPHSTRAVPLHFLRTVCAFADEHRLPVHMHVAEQQKELDDCLAEHGRTPVALLAGEGLLSERFNAVHAIHITEAEARALAAARANVCACPTTERNLGDGIVPADILFRAGVKVSLGTDSHTQIDLLEDARELEYHLRLDKQRRNVLAPDDDAQRETLAALNDEGDDKGDDEGRDEQARDKMSALAARLFACASVNGARSIGARGGTLAAGQPADFFTVALDDPSIAGASQQDLLPSILFSLARTALRETVVGGRLIVADGRHASSPEIIERFKALQRRLWS